MQDNLLNIHRKQGKLTWESICVDHVFFAISESEKRLRDELGKENFFVFPLGSFLNLRLMAEIAGVDLTSETIPELLGDIDILMLTDILTPEEERAFYDLVVDRLEPVVNRYLRIHTGLELCWVYNLQLHPTQFANPEVYIPIYDVNSFEDSIENAGLTIAAIHRVLEAINMASLFGSGEFYSDLIKTLEIAYATDKFKERDTLEYRKKVAEELNDQGIVTYQGNILIYIAEKLYNPGFPALKQKHIKRALKLKLGRVPTENEIQSITNELITKGYNVQLS